MKSTSNSLEEAAIFLDLCNWILNFSLFHVDSAVRLRITDNGNGYVAFLNADGSMFHNEHAGQEYKELKTVGEPI